MRGTKIFNLKEQNERNWRVGNCIKDLFFGGEINFIAKIEINHFQLSSP